MLNVGIENFCNRLASKVASEWKIAYGIWKEYWKPLSLVQQNLLAEEVAAQYLQYSHWYEIDSALHPRPKCTNMTNTRAHSRSLPLECTLPPHQKPTGIRWMLYTYRNTKENTNTTNTKCKHEHTIARWKSSIMLLFKRILLQSFASIFIFAAKIPLVFSTRSLRAKHCEILQREARWTMKLNKWFETNAPFSCSFSMYLAVLCCTELKTSCVRIWKPMESDMNNKQNPNEE